METTGKQPQRRTVHNGVAIGNWLINSIRPQKDKLPEEIVRKLDELGFVWETSRRRSASVRASDTGKREAQQVEIPVDTWVRYFELCRGCMHTLSRKLVITDMFHGIDVGFWFYMQNRTYAAGILSDQKRRLFGSLILLDESLGSRVREWYWRYSHCLESVVLRGVNPSDDPEVTLASRATKGWFAQQVELMTKGTLAPSQQKAMEELLEIAKESMRANNHSPRPEGSTDT